MKKFLRFFAVVYMVSGLIAFSPWQSTAQVKSPRVVSGKVLVKFSPQMETKLSQMKVGRKNGYIQTGLAGFDALAYKHQTTALKRVFPYNPRKDEAHRRHGLHLWYELTIPINKDVESVVREFKGVQGIAHAEPIHAKAMINPGQPKIVTEPMGAINGPVNDPFFYLQWHYENDGVTNGGISEADINLKEAWKTQTGNPNVVVCVHDLGIDAKHKDLASNMWVNTAEKNGRPGVDDDFNGYVDDVYGYDFSDDNGNVPPGDHGTHVGGTIAAVSNNGIGVSGVAGGDGTNPGVRLMTAKILNGSYDNIAASYVYAADNGAVISQNSWGYTMPGAVDLAVLAGIDYFIEEAGNFPNSPMKGGIVIFASGNSASDLDYYPARYDRVLSVASLTRSNTRAYYSNYGPWVDIAAPGGEQIDLMENGILSTLPNNQYGFFQGTSMACPHVSGIAALIVSEYGSKEYTAQDLWTALVTGTRDINQYNPEYQNQLGIGYIDAALALKKNGRIAPAKVADLTVAETGMDFLNLTWSATADEDDDVATRYEAIFGKDSLEVASRQNIKSVWVNESKPAGEQVTAALEELYPNTKYFVAVNAYDRWGNRSATSTIVSSTTTDGPSVSIDKPSIEFNIDVNSGTVAVDQFNLINAGAGDLKWKAEVRQKDYFLDWNNVRYPAASSVTPSSAELKMRAARGPFQPKHQVTTHGYNDDYEERSMRYILDEYWGGYMIGEEDTSIPNSAATRFKVSYEDGFNLTNINMLLNNNAERGDPPFVVEVYRGEELDKKNLVYAAQYSGYTNFDNVYNIQLAHQIFFGYGETFWVAVHMPAGHLYPLGINDETQDEYSENCYMSFDVGKTWSRLEDLIPYNFYAWSHAAISRTPGLERYLTIEPGEGTVPGSNQQELTATADAARLINGTYYADVVMLNNDFENKLASIPATVTVAGQTAELSSEAIVSFGSVFTGVEKEVEIEIENKGYGNFTVANATVSHADFTIVNSPYKISALDKSTVMVRFKPSAAAQRNASLILEDQNGLQHKISLVGTGVLPSKISVTPASANYTMAIGQETSGKFKIKNTGSYPLQFFAPKYSSGEGIDYVDNGFNKFGYSYRTSADGSGLTYSWEDISSTGTEIGEFFKDVISNNFYPVNLGFDFPIFNQTTNKLMITRYGILTIDDRVNLVGNSIQLGDEWMPYGFISGLNQKVSTEGGGKIYYQAKSGRFIVQYENVASAFDENQRYTFQMIVYDNGTTRVNYKDLSTLDSWNLDYIELAIEDPDKQAGYLISNYKKPINATSNFSVEIVSPGANIITGLSTTQGTLGVGEETEITYDVSAASLTEGTFWQNLVIVSNDPVTPSTMFKVNVTVNSGGVANVTADASDIDMGEIFGGQTVETTIQVMNTGTKGAQLTGITSDHGYFTITHDALPIALKPKSSSYVHVKFTGASPAVVEDVIHITANTGAHNVAVKATVLDPPAIELTYDPINDVLDAGESAMHAIQIKNTGTAELRVVPSGPSWAIMVPNAAPGSAGVQYPKNTYYWKKSTQEGGPTYIWEEIMDKSTKLDFAMDPFVPEEKEVELPFTFNFYGKDYTKMYVSPKGFVTFTPGQEVGFFPSSTIPSAEAPNNLIAPFWGPGAYYSLENDIWGVYAKVQEDVVIVEFVYAYNVFGMGDPWNYQVLLYANGNIKFQYQLPFNYSNTIHGVIGVENEDGSEGVRIAAYQNFVEHELAVMLTPANRLDIASGETITLNLKVDASELFAGTYSDNLLLQTNVPGSTDLQIPLNLTVNGNPEFVVSESLDFGDIVAEEVDGELKTFSKEFLVTNAGTATLDISQFQLANSESSFSLWMEFSDWFGTYWDVVPSDFTFSLTPKTSKKFKVEIMPELGEDLLKDSIMVVSNSPEGTIKVPVRASVVLPAVMAVDKTSIVFLAPDHNFTGTDSFVIGNTEGQSTLNYSISVNYKRTGGVPAFTASKEVPDSELMRPTAVKNTRLTPSIMGVEGYNRTLEYSDVQQPEGHIGFGIGSMFVSGTKYVTPGDGFTLSHVQTYYASGELAQSTLTMGIYIGEDILNAKLMYAKAYDLTVGKNFEGEVLLDLESPVHFYPGETFWIVIWNPFGSSHPQGYNTIDETVKGTFLYYFPDFGIWGDITDDPQFRKVAWSVRALEKDFVNGSWLTIESPTQGQVAAGEMATINLKADATGVMDADTYAEMTITSNSTGSSTAKVLVNLHMNQAPQFAEQADGQWTDEMKPLVFTVPVTDIEGDAISFNIPDAPEGMTWDAVDGGVEISYTPDYLSAGVKSINIHAKDAGNRESVLPLSVAVYNVNRAPVLVSNADRNYDYGSDAEEISLDEIISDADTDDVLSVSVTSSDVEVVEVMASANSIRINPGKPGQAVMTVTVTDPYGATVTTTVNVIVHMVTAIETPYFGDVKVYPNPARQFVQVEFSDAASMAKEIRIMDVAGNVVKQSSLNQTRSSVDVSNLAPGMYILRLSREDRYHVIKFIKN